MAAAVLAGTAWIDDAPPLEFVALLITLYVAARVATQAGALVSAAPFRNRGLKIGFALLALALLGGAFFIVAIFVERIALAVSA